MQVLSNLLSNALRHARECTPVWVRARALPVIFEPFRRGLSDDRPSGSLGLYFVRQVVEGHRGRMEVSTGEAALPFTVRVPVA